MIPKHIAWNEIQMECCGVCESPSITIETKSGKRGLYWKCSDCGSMLFKPQKVQRSVVYDVPPERDENDIMIDGTGSGLRKETDEEMRLRAKKWNEELEQLCDGKVVLIKRTDEEHKKRLLYGGEENQKARTLDAVLDAWGMDSLEQMTNELARLKRLEDSLFVLPQSQRELIEKCQSELPLVNLADYYFESKPLLYRMV